jgi:hypothetical protein
MTRRQADLLFGLAVGAVVVALMGLAWWAARQVTDIMLPGVPQVLG